MKIAILILFVMTAFSCKKCYYCDAIDTVTNEIYHSESGICDETDRQDFEAVFNDPLADSRAECYRE